MKTVLNELYEALYNTRPEQWADVLFNDKERLLEKERQQLIDAGNSCAMKQYLHERKVSEMTNDELSKFVETITCTFGEDYYNETFKNGVGL